MRLFCNAYRHRLIDIAGACVFFDKNGVSEDLKLKPHVYEALLGTNPGMTPYPSVAKESISVVHDATQKVSGIKQDTARVQQMIPSTKVVSFEVELKSEKSEVSLLSTQSLPNSEVSSLITKKEKKEEELPVLEADKEASFFGAEIEKPLEVPVEKPLNELKAPVIPNVVEVPDKKKKPRRPRQQIDQDNK